MGLFRKGGVIILPNRDDAARYAFPANSLPTHLAETINVTSGDLRIGWEIASLDKEKWPISERILICINVEPDGNYSQGLLDPETLSELKRKEGNTVGWPHQFSATGAICVGSGMLPRRIDSWKTMIDIVDTIRRAISYSHLREMSYEILDGVNMYVRPDVLVFDIANRRGVARDNPQRVSSWFRDTAGDIASKYYTPSKRKPSDFMMVDNEPAIKASFIRRTWADEGLYEMIDHSWVRFIEEFEEEEEV